MIDTRRWVYGTRTELWYLVDSKDRDWSIGIGQEEMVAIGPDAAKEKYLSPTWL